MINYLIETYGRETITKYLRLAVFLGFYILFRQYYANWSKEKQLQRQLEIDEEEKKNKPEIERKKKEELVEKLQQEEKAFGWGKKTRSRQKQAQTIINELAEETRARHQSAYDAAEDHDIDDLLED